MAANVMIMIVNKTRYTVLLSIFSKKNPHEKKNNCSTRSLPLNHNCIAYYVLHTPPFFQQSSIHFVAVNKYEYSSFGTIPMWNSKQVCTRIMYCFGLNWVCSVVRFARFPVPVDSCRLRSAKATLTAPISPQFTAHFKLDLSNRSLVFLGNLRNVFFCVQFFFVRFFFFLFGINSFFHSFWNRFLLMNIIFWYFFHMNFQCYLKKYFA